jgi:hypothetical protein
VSGKAAIKHQRLRGLDWGCVCVWGGGAAADARRVHGGSPTCCAVGLSHCTPLPHPMRPSCLGRKIRSVRAPVVLAPATVTVLPCSSPAADLAACARPAHPPAPPSPPQGFAPIPVKLPKILGEDLAGVVVEAPEGSKVGGCAAAPLAAAGPGAHAAALALVSLTPGARPSAPTASCCRCHPAGAVQEGRPRVC